jgi:hypothetical protein
VGERIAVKGKFAEYKNPAPGLRFSERFCLHADSSGSRVKSCRQWRSVVTRAPRFKWLEGQQAQAVEMNSYTCSCFNYGALSCAHGDTD